MSATRRARLRRWCVASVLAACVALVTTGCDGGSGGTAAAGTAANGQANAQPLPPASSLIQGAPPLVFEPPVMDIGLLRVGESGTGSVMVRNAGASPVRIAHTPASCACTYAKDLRGTVIEPGQAVKLEGEITPKSGLGPKREQIRVICDNYASYVVVDVIAEVSLAVRAIPGDIPAYKVGNTGTVVVESLDRRPFRIIRADGRVPVHADGSQPGVASDRHTLRWDLNGYTAQTIPWYWVIETDHPEAPVVDLRVKHNWTRNPTGKPRWVRGDNRILGGALRKGDTFQFKTKVSYNSKVTMLPPGEPHVVAASPGIHARLVSSEIVGTDIVCTIDVLVLAGGPGLLYESLRISHGGYTAPPVHFFAQLLE